MVDKPLSEWSEAELAEWFSSFDLDQERDRRMRAAEPQWELEAPFRLENLDLLSLTGDEIFHFAKMLQDELRRVRQVLHVAVEQLAIAQKKRWPVSSCKSHRPSPPNPDQERRAANERTISERRSINY